MEPSFTIAIPTFDRPEPLRHLLSLARSQGLSNLARVVVYDDGPNSGTYAMLTREGFLTELRYERNEHNLGYARNFLRILGETETTHVLVTADDDVLDRDGIETTIAELTRDAADLLVTSFRAHDGALIRSRRVPGPVLPSEIHKAFSHAPGLVYRADSARPYLPFLERRLMLGCAATTYYPQVVLGTILAMRHQARWVPATPVIEGARCATGLRDEAGRPYNAGVNRFAQLIAFDEVFTELQALATSQGERRFIEAVLSQHRRGAFKRIIRAVGREAPELAMAVERSATAYALRHPRRVLRAWLHRRRRA